MTSSKEDLRTSFPDFQLRFSSQIWVEAVISLSLLRSLMYRSLGFRPVNRIDFDAVAKVKDPLLIKVIHFCTSVHHFLQLLNHHALASFNHFFDDFLIFFFYQSEI